MTLSDLQSCPFCGGCNVHLLFDDWGWLVFCESCLSRGSRFNPIDGEHTHHDRAQTQAITAWNRRFVPEIAEQAKTIAELRAALVGLVPGHRDPDVRCWCHYGRNTDFGHTVECIHARTVFDKGDAS